MLAEARPQYCMTRVVVVWISELRLCLYAIVPHVKEYKSSKTGASVYLIL
jgi:hypothetical protein